MKLLDFSLKLNELKEVFKMSQSELHGYVYATLQGHFGKKKVHAKHGSYVYAQGTIPVVVLAHLDTVHDILPTDDTLMFDPERMTMWCQDGIGADCRAGVFNILDILAKGYRPHVIFTWDEEIGGVGARKFVDDFSESKPEMSKFLMDNVNFAIQFDRHGFSEAVYYDLDSQEFENYINSFGYNTEIGSYTDICEICPAYGFAGVNVAAGYTNEHQKHEALWIEEMHESNKKVILMLEDQIEKPQHFPYIELEYAGWGSAYGWGGYNYSGKTGTTTLFEPTKYCSSCFNPKDLLEWSQSFDPRLNGMCDLCRTEHLEKLKELEDRIESEKSSNSELVLYCETCGGTIEEDQDSYLEGEENYFCSRDCFEKRN